MRFHYDANRQDSKLYQKWNRTTICCYEHNMICKGCPNDYACACNQENFNKYHIRQIKFSTLMTYANIGKPTKRYEDFEDEFEDE